VSAEIATPKQLDRFADYLGKFASFVIDLTRQLQAFKFFVKRVHKPTDKKNAQCFCRHRCPNTFTKTPPPIRRAPGIFPGYAASPTISSASTNPTPSPR
jgi:hypothetical protein